MSQIKELGLVGSLCSLRAFSDILDIRNMYCNYVCQFFLRVNMKRLFVSMFSHISEQAIIMNKVGNQEADEV